MRKEEYYYSLNELLFGDLTIRSDAVYIQGENHWNHRRTFRARLASLANKRAV